MSAHRDDPDPLHEARAVALGEALRAAGWLCATAESCTGGLVAGAITAIPGSSAWFERGFVTYSNEAKVEMLDVPPAVIAAAGAVAEVTACAMARGALSASRAHVAVAVTGIAGPGGAVPGKPVGTVCFAWAVRDRAPYAKTHLIVGDRAAVRAASVGIALDGLIVLVRGG